MIYRGGVEKRVKFCEVLSKAQSEVAIAVKFWTSVQSEVNFAHSAARQNFTYEVNFTTDGNFTCPKGKLSSIPR